MIDFKSGPIKNFTNKVNSYYLYFNLTITYHFRNVIMFANEKLQKHVCPSWYALMMQILTKRANINETSIPTEG